MKITGLLAMLRNRSKREKLYSAAEYWDAKASELDGDAVSMWPNNSLNALYHREQMELIDAAIGSLKGKKVLDVGCGTGRLARFLACRGASVVGIDFSTKAIEIARKCSTPGNPEFKQMSVFELNAEKEYDLIFSWGCVVMAARDQSELLVALRALRRAAKHGGSALFLEPIHRGFVHRVLNMDLREFCEVMLEAGFSVGWVKQMHFWPMRFFLAFFNWPKCVTLPCYHLGQALMKAPILRSMGDYKAIMATAI